NFGELHLEALPGTQKGCRLGFDELLDFVKNGIPPLVRGHKCVLHVRKVLGMIEDHRDLARLRFFGVSREDCACPEQAEEGDYTEGFSVHGSPCLEPLSPKMLQRRPASADRS